MCLNSKLRHGENAHIWIYRCAAQNGQHIEHGTMSHVIWADRSARLYENHANPITPNCIWSRMKTASGQIDR